MLCIFMLLRNDCILVCWAATAGGYLSFCTLKMYDSLWLNMFGLKVFFMSTDCTTQTIPTSTIKS